MSVTPNKGPSGTSATIKITGALPNAPVTLELDPGSTNGTTDANGEWTYTHTFFGQVGDVSNLKATIGAANEQSATGTFEITGEAGLDISDAGGQVAPAGPTLTVSPDKGPSGTSATITIGGALPNAPVTLDLDPGSTNGTTDANGSWTYTHTFFGQVGDVANIQATIGPASEQSASGTFEITGETGQAALQAGDEGVSVSVDPNKGPSGTTATITVSGGEPNQPVTLQIGEAITSGTTDANGSFAYEFTFYGQIGDVIAIEATVGSSSDSPKSSTSFEITAPLEQTFNATTTPHAGNLEHDPFVKLRRELNLRARYGSLILEGDAPWVTVSGELGTDGVISLRGSGTVAGFADIAVTFEGTISMQHIEGEYTMGADGGLPGGEPIVYLVEGSGETAETPAAEEPPGSERVVIFFDGLNAAQTAGDAEMMFALLHPAVIELYGAEACQTYLEGIVNPSVLIEVSAVTAYGPWDWTIDGRTIPIDTAYTFDAVVSSDQGEALQEAHVAERPDGTLGWFTDCGEPLE
jgi:hypothetical protein